ncbi:MAG: T9SS type A sorting domain-containing protein [Bacteroidota bacterium]
MMKKLFLLSATFAISAMSASAQLQSRTINSTSNRAFMDGKAEKIAPSGPSMLKTTATAPRRYDHQAYVESISSTMLGSTIPIWQDSTIRVNYTSGIGSINFTSVCQVLCPFDNLWNDVTNPAFIGKTEIKATNSYTVDSVSLSALYFVGNSASTSTVDTLEISLGYQPVTAFYYWRTATSPWASSYLPSGKDTLKWLTPINVDSVRKLGKSYPYTGTTSFSWKEPLTAAMRTASTVTTFQTFSYKVPSTFTVPAGNVLIITYTFRTGDTWNKNVDTITQKHNFRPGFAGTGSSTASTPMKYSWYSGDHSGSSIMFSTDTNFYAPTLVIGATNDPTAWFNQYLLSTATLSCSSCFNVGVKESTLISDVKAFPIPANNELNIPFTVKEKSNVTISLSNLLGQVVATQNMSNVNAGQSNTAVFNTANLVNGVYIYTIEANGQRSSNRFSVAH